MLPHGNHSDSGSRAYPHHNLWAQTHLGVYKRAFDVCDALTEVIIDSEYVYTNATSTLACGYLLDNATTVKVLTSLVISNHRYINTTNFPNISTEVIGEKNYTVYSK